MTIPFSEITEKRHHPSGAFLFYRQDDGLYKKYLITSYNDDETVDLEEVEG